MSPQWRPIGHIDLTGIKTNDEFEKLWFTNVQKTGEFILRSAYSFGDRRIMQKQIARIKVSSIIEHIDKRRLLPRIFEQNEEIMELESLY